MKMTKSIPRQNRTKPNKLAASLAVLLVILPCSSKAQERVLTLHDCIAIALGESPKLEASRFDLLAATEEIRAAQSMTLPNLSGSAAFEYLTGQRTSTFQFVDTSSNAVTAQPNVSGGVDILGARLVYPVFKDGSFLGLNTAPAVAGRKAQEHALAWTAHLSREEVIYRITNAFITTVSARNRREFADRKVDLWEQSVGLIREQQKQGLVLPIDLRVAKEQLQGAQGLAKIIHEQAVAGELEIARALALPSTSSVNLSTTLPDPPEPPSAKQLLGTSLMTHPSLEMQRATIDKAKQDYRLERFRLYPSVSLNGAAFYANDFRFQRTGASLYTATLTVNVPIFDFGAQSATVRARRMTYLAEQARLGSVADDVTNNIVQTYESISAVSEAILARQEEIAKADRDTRVQASQQQQGLTEPLKPLETELTLLTKRDELATLEARRLLLYAALQQAAGGTWKWLP